MADFVDEDGIRRDLDAEQAQYEAKYRFRVRYSSKFETWNASANRKVWPLHGYSADGETPEQSRATLLNIMKEPFDLY